MSDELLVDNDTQLPAVEVFFDDAVRATILAELGRVRSSVRFVTYTFRDEAVMTALNTLAGQGIDVAGIAGSAIEAGTPHYPLVSYEDTGVFALSTSLLTPSRTPVSTSAWRTQFRNPSG